MKRKIRTKSLILALIVVVCMMAIIGIKTEPVKAAGEKEDITLLVFPRSEDEQYDANWGHEELTFMNGWKTNESPYTAIRSIEGGSGQICYCIEPGVPQHSGDEFTGWDENFWDNYPAELNRTISPDEIKTFLGRIMQYGYTGNISRSWLSQNEGAEPLAKAVATQLLVWEVVVGERDSSFGKVDTGSHDQILDCITTGHPLREKILGYYQQIEKQVKQHTVIPSFCEKSIGKASTFELKWNVEAYQGEFADENQILNEYSFTSDDPNISIEVKGDRLIVLSKEALTQSVMISASKKASQRKGVITWTDGSIGPDGGRQDTVTYGQSVTDPVNGFFKVKVSNGGLKIIKTSEDGKVGGVSFTIKGNGIETTVTTDENGIIVVDELIPGEYIVTEIQDDPYEPQETKQVTVQNGETTEIKFHNSLKKGELVVTKNSEDGMEEGLTFRLQGTSESGIPVDVTAQTDSTGKAYFKDLPEGSGYILEEVDTSEKYVIPEAQSVDILWNEVTEKTVTNAVKKWKASVIKYDEEHGSAQGNATLSGAVYGVYRGEELIDSYETDENGMFVTTYYPCGEDWTIREITPSEGYLLDETIYPVGAEPGDYKEEFNSLELKVAERIVKGQVQVKKTGENEELLEGAVIGLFHTGCKEFTKENAIAKATSQGEEPITFSDIPYGEWLIAEIESPEGYLITERTYPVSITENDQVIEIEISNKQIYGSVQLLKLDAEYPENRLSGAEFTVYEDKNGNLVLDDGEMVQGILKEIDDGCYELKDIPYGYYLLKETKSPDGFYPDERIYPFSIIEDGQKITIENEAGKGFINMPHRGSLKILKTSSDGKVKGFSFQVTGPHGYDQTFTTDENGEIMISDLRIGTYRICEIRDGASSGYILPKEQEVLITEGTEITIKMHNALQDIPKTGDDSNGILWMGLLGVSLLGTVIVFYVVIKNRKEAEN